MKIIVHSSYSAQTIGANLGKAEYSYYFVLAGYLPALRRLGEVVTVDDPETEADAIYDAAKAKGEACVFLSFAPPHFVPITLRCPTIPVVAWEFSTIPCEMWSDDPRSDWRNVFAHCKRVIALSHHTAALVRAAMGPDFPVFAIPTASYEAFADIGPARPVDEEQLLHLRGYLFDSAADERFARTPPWPAVPAAPFVPQPAEVRIEPQVEAVSVPAPAPAQLSLRGRVSRTIYYLRAWYHDVVRDILPAPLKRLASACGRYLYRKFRGNKKAPPVPAPVPVLPVLPDCEVALRGVVYTSVFAPQDGRKNWQDLLSGFVWAFRDNPGATLFLKVPVRGGVEAYPILHSILTQFAPFKCRVVFFAGFLDDTQYHALVRGSTYYVNTSHGEGLCLPLMEFLSAGRPAVAPNHTAMADYIDTNIAFVLRANLEHNVWPFDPRDLFTTMRYRLEWESLVTSFEQSYAQAGTAAYAAMSEAAQNAMRGFCTLDLVQAKLSEALGITAPALAVPHAGMVAA
jgi:glycosyltransferase involved in cell wall biosynthesis